MKRVLMLHQRGRWEMKLSAPPICLAHPSIYGSDPSCPRSREKKEEELVRECKPPEAFRSVPTGHHPAPLPTRGRLCRGALTRQKRPTSLCQHAARGVTLRGCHTLDSRGLCLCMH